MQISLKTKKGLIVTAAVLTVGAAVIIISKKKLKAKYAASKVDNVNEIMQNPNSGLQYDQATYDFLMKLGDDYIALWNQALKEGKTYFMLSSKTYTTRGGTAIVANQPIQPAPDKSNTVYVPFIFGGTGGFWF